MGLSLSKSCQSPKASPFLELPPELRLQIHAHVLADYDTALKTRANLLHTSRLIRAEAMRLFYDHLWGFDKALDDNSMRDFGRCGATRALVHEMLMGMKRMSRQGGEFRFFRFRMVRMMVEAGFPVHEWK